MDKPLTPTMKRCVKYMQKAGKLIRYPGGYWAAEHWERWITPWYGTSTVEALVRRGEAVYIQWKDGKHGKFPVEVTIKTHKGEQ